MISGQNVMPHPDGTERIGYLGSGCVRISSSNSLPFNTFTCKRNEYFNLSNLNHLIASLIINGIISMN